jgi:hypothetical protein
MKRLFTIAMLLVMAGGLSACGGTWAGVKSDTSSMYKDVVPPTPAPAPTVDWLQSQINILVTVDAPAAIAKAQKEAAAPGTPADKAVLALGRAGCYQTIVAIVPDIPLLNSIEPGPTVGILDNFETAVEVTDSLVTTLQTGILPVADQSKFTIACGWLPQQFLNNLAALGLKLLPFKP